MIVASSQVLDLLETGMAGERYLLLFEMASGSYGFWNNNYDLSYNSVTYKGVPGVFQIADYSSSNNLAIGQMDIIFNNLDPDISSRVENESYHRRPVVGHKAIIDETTGVLVDIIEWFTAVIDQVETEEQVGGTTQLVVKLDVGNWELLRRSDRTRSNSDQQAIVTGDKGFEYVNAAVTQPIFWGRAGPVRPSNAVRVVGST